MVYTAMVVAQYPLLCVRQLNVHVLMRDEQARSYTNNQHSTPKAVTFPKKNELPQVGLKPTTLHMYIINLIISVPGEL